MRAPAYRRGRNAKKPELRRAHCARIRESSHSSLKRLIYLDEQTRNKGGIIMKNSMQILAEVLRGLHVGRRFFLGASIAAGAALTFGASRSVLMGIARAAEPKQGGVLKVGLAGGSTTDTLDPA